MNIIKKSGLLQEFIVEKIEISIKNASDDIDQPMTQSDARNMAVQAMHSIAQFRKDYTSSYEVFGMVINILDTEGFKAVSEAYFKGRLS